MPDQVSLRDITAADLPLFFEHPLDAEANYMAAFTAPDPTDREAFMARWARILSDDSIINRAIVVDDQVAGHIAHFEQFGQPSVSYWVGRAFWGRGVATRALSQFLQVVTVRPLYARAARDNRASVRVLEKCGFRVVGEDSGFSEARGEDVEELIFKLEDA